MLRMRTMRLAEDRARGRDVVRFRLSTTGAQVNVSIREVAEQYAGTDKILEVKCNPKYMKYNDAFLEWLKRYDIEAKLYSDEVE